ncbi:MAG: DUF1501 domain-containing protein [Pirellula sp.]
MTNFLPYDSGPTSRRQWLQRAGGGFGALALAGILQKQSMAENGILAAPHFRPRAKRVVYLSMNGGPSHVDTFDPKPSLAKFEGDQPEKIKSKGTGYMPSPFQFEPRGESGVVMSELFPNLARCADDLCVIRSMHTDTPNHEPGLLMMNSGHQQPVRPSLGAWTSYGLGSENDNLPSFITLSPGLPVVGPQLWSSAFLPGQHQGMAVDTNEKDVEKLIANLNHPTLSRNEQRRQLDLLHKMNRRHSDQRTGDQDLEAHILAMEKAFRMQIEAGDTFDLSQEPQSVHDRYGSSVFARSCILARRLLERSVRFVQIHYITKTNKQPWDTHSNNNDGHRKLCADSDKATAALIQELKERGLLEDTLVMWGGEFGRTPYAQNDDKKPDAKPGRDHHNTGFSMFLAGGGVRGGQMYGETDDLGMHAVVNRVHVHDLHATILHLLGVDHTKLTYRYSGRDFRLTDVYGEVVKDIIQV